MSNIQTAVSLHRKLGTCLYKIIYSEYSILPPPKIFTIPPETSCILSVSKEWLLNVNFLQFVSSILPCPVIPSIYVKSHREDKIQQSNLLIFRDDLDTSCQVS